jgi:hypothetical protein
LKRRAVENYRIIAAAGGWTSLYEKRASEQDVDRVRGLAAGLAADLKVAAIAFLVHDSDIACYWLYDNGQLVDEYNSCPDYFAGPHYDPSQHTSRGPSGGSPEVLLRYCKAGVRSEELRDILAAETTFADDVVMVLATALGIDCERALVDYRDVAGDGTERAATVDRDPANPNVSHLRPEPPPAPDDPQVRALVEAAAAGAADLVDRLLAGGVAIDSEATIALPRPESKAWLGKYLSGEGPRIRMSPLIAAVVCDRKHSVDRLLKHGADANRIHPVYSTPLHFCAAYGKVELLQLLLDHGADATARDAEGQTPLQVVHAGLASAPATMEMVARSKEMMKTAGWGINMPGYAESLEHFTLPVEGWRACERLLVARGG